MKEFETPFWKCSTFPITCTDGPRTETGLIWDGFSIYKSLAYSEDKSVVLFELNSLSTGLKLATFSTVWDAQDAAADLKVLHDDWSFEGIKKLRELSKDQQVHDIFTKWYSVSPMGKKPKADELVDMTKAYN